MQLLVKFLTFTQVCMLLKGRVNQSTKNVIPVRDTNLLSCCCFFFLLFTLLKILAIHSGNKQSIQHSVLSYCLHRLHVAN